MLRPASVLLIDDDASTAPAVKSVLLREGYHVDCAPRGPLALQQVRRHPPDMVILGIGTANGGWTFCRQLQGCFDGTLFLLLASDTEDQRVKALSLGAADCLSKPFAVIEFVARVRALLRRGTAHATRGERTYFVDIDLLVDLTREEVWRDDQLVSLTPTEFRLMAALVKREGQLLPHAHLLAEVWGPDHNRGPDALWAHIHHLRQKLEPDPDQPQRIVNRPRKGYIFQRLGNGKAFER
ncbi:MAG: response regulator transcription factor [Anaerolineae bacterium]